MRSPAMMVLFLMGLTPTACSMGTARAAVDGSFGPARKSGDNPGSDGSGAGFRQLIFAI
jgi:hypothetical protein